MESHCSLTHVLQWKNRVLPSAPPKCSAEPPERAALGELGSGERGQVACWDKVHAAIKLEGFPPGHVPQPTFSRNVFSQDSMFLRFEDRVCGHKATVSQNDGALVGITEVISPFRWTPCSLPITRSVIA